MQVRWRHSGAEQHLFSHAKHTAAIQGLKYGFLNTDSSLGLRSLSLKNACPETINRRSDKQALPEMAWLEPRLLLLLGELGAMRNL